MKRSRKEKEMSGVTYVGGSTIVDRGRFKVVEVGKKKK